MGTFESAVQESFTFLKHDFGYQISALSPGLVIYHRKGLVVIVRYDFPRSYELTLDIGTNDSSQPPFNFGEALRSCGSPPEIPSTYQVTSEVKLREYIERLAQNLRRHCSEILLENDNALARLRRLRERECEEFAKNRNLRYAREDMEKAWAAADYEEVIRILTPYETFLKESEKIKLKLARKRVS